MSKFSIEKNEVNLNDDNFTKFLEHLASYLVTVDNVTNMPDGTLFTFKMTVRKRFYGGFNFMEPCLFVEGIGSHE